jgi:5-methyltetrahydropteroyltriglutamate--homocysteine methyltransferase
MLIPTEPIGSIPRPPRLIDPHIETPEKVCDRVLEAAHYDDCGFSPFCDDTSTTREVAFAKIRARVLGTALAARALEGRA